MGVAIRWVLALLLLSPPSLAFAHAAPVTLDPPSGAVLAPGPVTLRLALSQAVELRFSKVTVQGPDRTWNAELRPEGEKSIAADLPALGPGRYGITWRVLAVDGHLTEGSYYVTVSPAGTHTSAHSPVTPSSNAGGVWMLSLGAALVCGVLASRHLRKSLMRG